MRFSEEELEEAALAKQLAVAFLATVAGLILAFYGNGSITSVPGGWLDRWLGQEGAALVDRALGALLALASGLWFVSCLRKMRALRERRG